MTAREAAEHVNSALRYLENFERAARLKNDRAAYLALEQSWLTLHEAFYGEYTAPRFILPEVPRKPVASVSAVKQDRPKWFREVQSRPMRKIVGTRETKEGTIHTLECGHRVSEICPVPGDKAQRRRCKQCAKRGAA